MCYFNGQKVSRAEFIQLKQLEKIVANYDFLNNPLQEGFDFGTSAVLKPVKGLQDFEITKMEWGFVPSYLKTREDIDRFRRGYRDLETGKWITGYDTLNAKSENLFVNDKGKPSMFRYAVKERRCLILSTGFYEWRHIFGKNKRTGQPLKTSVAYPYRIYLPEDEYFYFAGFWNPWRAQDGTGEYAETFTIVTTEANFLMRQVHNLKKRMPTILNEEFAYEWLFGNLDEQRITEIGKTQYPWQQMAAYTLPKDFKTALDPTAPFEYDPEIVSPLVLEEAA